MKKLELDKGTRYLLLFILALILIIIGALVGEIICYFPLYGQFGMSFSEYAKMNALLSYYFDNGSCKFDSTVSWAEYALEYFTENPEAFEYAKITACVRQVASNILPLALLVFLLWKDIKEDLKSFCKQWKKQVKLVLLGIASVVGATLLVGIIAQIMGDLDTSVNEKIIDLVIASDGKWVMFFAIVIIAPIVEELVFRKLIFGVCEEKLKLKPVFVIIISTFIFSIIHVTDLASIKYLYQYILIAAPIVIMYHYSGNNIITSILIHMGNNIISVITVILLWMI